MPVDKSVSKTAEDILKAAALFGLALFTADRMNSNFQCTQGDNILGMIGGAAITAFLFLLGLALLFHRLRDLYPWIFSGPSLSGKFVYAVIGILILVFTQPVARILLPHEVTQDGNSTYSCFDDGRTR